MIDSTWLRNRKVRGAVQLAEKALAAAESQYTSVTGEKPTAQLVHTLAKEVMRLNEQIAETDKLIEARFREHKHAEVIASMPGIWFLLGAEFLAATGGDMTAFDSSDRLAGFAGVAPAPRDSGKISGNLHRPRRYSRRLQRVFYTSALISIRCCDESRRFYDHEVILPTRPTGSRSAYDWRTIDRGRDSNASLWCPNLTGLDRRRSNPATERRNPEHGVARSLHLARSSGAARAPGRGPADHSAPAR